MSDFYLQDGATKVFINGSKAGFGKIQSVRDASASTSIFSQPPPGIQYLIGRHLGNAWNWMANQGRTGRFRYTQSSFDVNELVAALGVVRAGIDPMTSQPLKILDPITSNAV